MERQFFLKRRLERAFNKIHLHTFNGHSKRKKTLPKNTKNGKNGGIWGHFGR